MPSIHSIKWIQCLLLPNMSTPNSPTKIRPRMSPMPPQFFPKKLRGMEEPIIVNNDLDKQNGTICRVQSTSTLRIPKQRNSFWRRYGSLLHLSHLMTKPTKWHVRPAKTQISLGIRPVWSESLLSAWRKRWFLATHWAHSKDSIRPVWSESSLGTQSFCWFCHEAAHLCPVPAITQREVVFDDN